MRRILSSIGCLLGIVMLMYGRGIASPGNNRSLVISAVVMGTGLIIGLVSALVYYWDRAYKKPEVDELEILAEAHKQADILLANGVEKRG
jgi:hypothetical protein